MRPRATGRLLPAHWVALLSVAGAPAMAQSGGEVVGLLPGSARSAALGGAGAALVGDAGDIFANPAAIAAVRHLSVEGTYARYLGGTTLSSGAVALRLGRLEWGAGIQALDFGSEPEMVGGTPTGNTFTAIDAVGVTGLAYRRGMMAIGVTGKYARQQFGSYSAGGWGADAGFALAVFDIFALGASVQNIGGSGGSGIDLPRRVRAGFTMNYVDPEGTLRLLTTLEGQWPEGGSATLVTGVEGGVVAGGVGLLARAGYSGHSVGNAASHWSLGAGVALGHISLDYAYQSFSQLGDQTHRVGLRWTP
ncbi:MAG TPA: hypothetical protein VFK78_07105 [Gemmatimonadales bacterium]|nr:hypothetical protein [Gemmatimonadales bacterium]